MFRKVKRTGDNMTIKEYRDSMIKKVITLATKEVGYKETGTNITKYAAYFDKEYPEFYNTRKQGASWCDIFFDWLIVQVYGKELSLKVLNQPLHSCGAGCSFSYSYYKEHSKTPAIGYQIFFKDTKGKIVHTGIVYKVDATKVYTIEGNKSNQVKKCSYNLNSSKIYGYGCPDYSAGYKKDTEPEKPVTPVKPKMHDYIVIAKSGLNVRKDPSDKSKIFRVLPYNSEVLGIDNGTEWIKIKDGYIFKKWVTLKYSNDY